MDLINNLVDDIYIILKPLKGYVFSSFLIHTEDDYNYMNSWKYSTF